MFNTIKLIIITGMFAFHIYSWIYYYKKTDKEKRENDGWNSFYLITTIFLIDIILDLFNE
jgi:hypothetical protein